MSEWQAKWIAVNPDTYASTALPLFRREFKADRSIERATIRICGLGHYELHLNGQRVGDDVLSPGWTNYRKTCIYDVHDVTALLRAGDNAIGVMLGNGMYHVTGNRYKKFKGSFGPLKLIAELRLDFADGSPTTVPSDEQWRTSPGPITFSCIYGGEDYDARLEQPGWDAAGFDDSDWRAVAVVDGPGGELAKRVAPPSRVMRSFESMRRTDSADGKRVIDLGQNMSGRPAITARGPAGATVMLRTAELLDDAGAISQKNTGSPVSFSYTLRGDGEEHWQPRFSLTGFRYVEATVNANVDLTVRGQFVHAAAPVVGQFSCSNDLFNRIHALINAAILGNMHSVLTDCPHREKLGWLEQAHLMGPAIMMNYDVSRYYAKICRDMRDAQRDDGCVPTIAPEYVVFKPPWDVFSNSPEWGSAAVICPWLVYQQYGDRQILVDNYEMMRRYVAYLESREENGIVSFGLADWYDIGPGDPGFSKLTSQALTATAIYYCDCRTLSQSAAVLGKTDDAARYAEQAERILLAFNAKLFNPETGLYDRGSQTAQAMPLALEMVEPQHRPAVLEHLIDDISKNSNHITAGDIGFFYVLKALADADRSDVIFDLLSRTDPPSYGSQLARGATTLTEAWDANPKNSQNHLMLGHAELWFYQSLAGIRFDRSKPKAEQIVIKPAIVGDVTWSEARYDSVAGTIRSRWDRSGSTIRLAVTIPPGCAAKVHLPDRTIEVGEGSHTFESSFQPEKLQRT